jgi:Cu/Ag efflux protein CusF
MHRVLSGTILWTGIFLLTSCSSMRSDSQSAAAPNAQASGQVAGTIQESTVTATATVKKIDMKTRMVTLVGADGQSFTVKAGDEVKNLPQLKVGDEVVATYYQSIGYEVKKPGEGAPGVTVGQQLDTAKPGEKPGAVGARVVTVTATITGIDKSKGTVTLLGPDGDSVTVKARNPDNLNKVAKGDLVDITYTEALAIGVEPKQK